MYQGLISPPRSSLTWRAADVDRAVDSARDMGLYTSLALDSDGHPHISYYLGGPGGLRYARWTGEVWLVETVHDGWRVGSSTSLALDRDNLAHISYHDGGYRDLRYATLKPIEQHYLPLVWRGSGG